MTIKTPLNVIELNTMSNPVRGFIDETVRQRCKHCGNLFLLGYGMDIDPVVSAITDKHMELCNGDAAITLMLIHDWYSHRGGSQVLANLWGSKQ